MNYPSILEVAAFSFTTKYCFNQALQYSLKISLDNAENHGPDQRLLVNQTRQAQQTYRVIPQWCVIFNFSRLNRRPLRQWMSSPSPPLIDHLHCSRLSHCVVRPWNVIKSGPAGRPARFMTQVLCLQRKAPKSLEILDYRNVCNALSRLKIKIVIFMTPITTGTR